MPDHVCHAGRSAFFGGRWQEPCPNHGRHHIGSPEAEPVVLCDEHFRQANEANLVEEPHLGKEEFDRRERQRAGDQSKRRWWSRRN